MVELLSQQLVFGRIELEGVLAPMGELLELKHTGTNPTRPALFRKRPSGINLKALKMGIVFGGGGGGEL